MPSRSWPSGWASSTPPCRFILNSADIALRNYFGQSLASEGVQILDPFTGTGTFLVRLIQSGLLDPRRSNASTAPSFALTRSCC